MGRKVINKEKQWRGSVGEKVYAFGTGVVNVHKSSSLKASRLLRKQRGFKTVAGDERGTLWFYGGLQEAVKAKTEADKVGIRTTDTIFVYEVSEKNELDFVKEIKKGEAYGEAIWV